MPFTIIRQDIVHMNTDAIVCATNSSLYLDYGVALRVLEACPDRAGLLAECRRIGQLDVGKAAAVPSHGLGAKHIVFAVGPDCFEYEELPREQLYNTYISALTEADAAGDTSAALPFISTGAKGFPKDEALTVARHAIRDFLETHEMDVFLVLYDGESFELGKKRCGEIGDYLRGHEPRPMMSYAASDAMCDFEEAMAASVCPGAAARGVSAPAPNTPAPAPNAPLPSAPASKPGARRPKTLLGSAKKLFTSAAGESKSASPLFIPHEDTFTERLFKLIDARGLKDPEVYKKANIDRKLFSKIRSDAHYKPKKNTVLSLALALSLPMDETKDLLCRAGYALSPAIRADLIVMYYIERKQYDLYEINETLFYYGEQLLGA